MITVQQTSQKQRQIILLLVGIGLLWNNHSFAQQTQWRLAKGTDGIFVHAISIYLSNPDTIYAYGEKMLLSTDNGENWQSIGLGTTAYGVLKVMPERSKIIFVSHMALPFDGNEVLITTNGGLTWSSLFLGRGYSLPIIEIDPFALHTVYVSVNPNNMYRSSDYGSSWESVQMPPGENLYSFAIAPSDSNILYAAYSKGIYKSSDRGKNWTLLPFPLQNLCWPHIAVHPDNPDTIYVSTFSDGTVPGGVYKSTDGGLSWTEINNGLTSDDRDISAIVINPKNPEEVFIGLGDDTQIFSTTNGGSNWSPFSDGLPRSGHVNAIVIDTLNNKIYAATSSGIYIYNISNLVEIHKNLEFPKSYLLLQNYPNPFNETTVISYTLSERTYISLTVYDVSGRVVKNLEKGLKNPGIYQVELNATDLASGIYFYQLTAGGRSLVRKALLIK